MGVFTKIQIDLADGKLVDGKTLSLEEFIFTHEANRGLFSHFGIEFHLMVEESSIWIERLVNL